MHNSPNLWLSSYPWPQREGHKYDRGHALICGGEVMTGATRLSARAAQRIGAGLVTLAAPPKSAKIYAEALESVIVREIHDIKGWEELLDDSKRNAVLIGPGLGFGALQTKSVLAALESGKTCVIDADALTAFSGQPQALLSKLHENCILTPHEGEFTKLFGSKIDPDLPKLERAKQAAKLSKAYILLKGSETIIVPPKGEAIVNDNAPPWLATGGAGDVLAGLILGLVAQKMPIMKAAAAAAWLHGKIASGFGMGLIAEDLVEGIPKAVQELEAMKP